MPERAFATGRFLLSLDKQPVLLNDVDGGTIRADVVTISTGPQNVARKQLSPIKYESFTINVGMSMGKPLAEWIRATLDHSYVRKNGSVVATNIDNKAQSYRNFRDAIIEEVTIPPMDASNKEPAFFTIKFKPEEITYVKGDGAVVQGVAGAKQKRWLPSNFRLRIGDLPCARVSKVDAITIKQGVTKEAIGDVRIQTKQPTNLEFPNLKVAFSAVDAGPWQDWFTEFVIKGNNGQEKELQGALEFLDPATTDVLGSVDFFQVGIFALYPEKLVSGAEQIARYIAELYVEKMAINLKDV